MVNTECPIIWLVVPQNVNYYEKGCNLCNLCSGSEFSCLFVFYALLLQISIKQGLNYYYFQAVTTEVTAEKLN